LRIDAINSADSGETAARAGRRQVRGDATAPAASAPASVRAPRQYYLRAFHRAFSQSVVDCISPRRANLHPRRHLYHHRSNAGGDRRDFGRIHKTKRSRRCLPI
jgi:hypothetical protein